MGNYFAKENDVDKASALRNLNVCWEMKEEVKNDDSKVKQYNLITGSTFTDLDWEVETEVITEHEFTDNKPTELCTKNFDVILGTSSITDVKFFSGSSEASPSVHTYVPHIYYNNMSVSHPLFTCLIDYGEVKTRFGYKKKMKFYGLRFKRTEKFLKDVQEIKAGKKSFSHGKLNYSSGFVGIKL